MVEIKFNLTGKEQPAKVAQVLALIYALDPSTMLDASTTKPGIENETGDILTNNDGSLVALESETEVKKPAKKKRRTKAEIEADKKAEKEKAEALNDELKNVDDSDDEDGGDFTAGLFDIPDDDDGDDNDDDDDNDNELDTSDKNHVTVIADKIAELMEANRNNKTKIQNILTKKLKKERAKDLNDKEKKFFYAELLKLEK